MLSPPDALYPKLLRAPGISYACWSLVVRLAAMCSCVVWTGHPPLGAPSRVLKFLLLLLLCSERVGKRTFHLPTTGT